MLDNNKINRIFFLQCLLIALIIHIILLVIADNIDMNMRKIQNLEPVTIDLTDNFKENYFSSIDNYNPIKKEDIPNFTQTDKKNDIIIKQEKKVEIKEVIEPVIKQEKKVEIKEIIEPVIKKEKKVEIKEVIEPVIKKEKTIETKTSFPEADPTYQTKDSSNNPTKAESLEKTKNQSEDINTYKNLLRNKIQIYATKRYPKRSLKKKEQGTVELIFKLSANGTLIDIKTGSKTDAPKRLVEAAIEAVRKNSPFEKSHVLEIKNEFSILIVYKLN